MLKHLKIGASALALSAFVLAPVATVVTADMAVAKSENAGGQGNGNGGGKGNSAGKSGDKGAKGHAGGKGKKAKGGKSSAKMYDRTIQDDFKTFKKHGFKGLFGKKNNSTAKAAASAPKAAKKSASFKADPMHPSNLGKMNGFLNSSPNAKLAHIANGQYLKGTGPVSLAAGLAVAKYEFGLVEDAVATQAIVDAYAALDAYTPEQIAASESLLGTYDADGNGVLEGDELTAATDAGVAPEAITEAEAVNMAQAGVIDPDTGEPYTPPTDEEIAAADEVLGDYPEGVDPLVAAGGALTEAEMAALSTYKGDYDALSDEDKQTVLDAMHAALPQDDMAIQEALDKYGAKTAEESATDGDEPLDESAELTDEEVIVDEG